MEPPERDAWQVRQGARFGAPKAFSRKLGVGADRRGDDGNTMPALAIRAERPIEAWRASSVMKRPYVERAEHQHVHVRLWGSVASVPEDSNVTLQIAF